MPHTTEYLRLVLPLAIVCGLFIVFVPLAPGIVDLLLALNLGAAVLVLLTSLFISRPLDFSVFPALLLLTTLGRLFLNIATTRMILSHAVTAGTNAAGGIVAAFGQWVAGDNLVVGLVIFAILVIVQLVVVTQGSSRVSEVAARFTLDGLPGRQMTIDSELHAGVITQAEARQQRADLKRQADFFGAMDGASKFLRGDAIAGLLIIIINIVGGLYRGLVDGGMSWSEACDVYVKLTIGDGLASQIPAFLVAIAGGLLVTRSSEDSNFSVEFLRQTLSRPEAAILVALFLAALTLGGMPVLPLAAIGVAVVTTTVWLRRTGATPQGKVALAPTNSSAAGARSAGERPLVYDPLELELGLKLLPLAKPQDGSELLPRIGQLRDRLLHDVGIILPRLRVRDNLNLGPEEFRLLIFGREVLRRRIWVSRSLAVATSSVATPLHGAPARGLLSQQQAWWIDSAQVELARSEGYRLMSSTDALLEAVYQALRRHADDLLTRDAVQTLLDSAKKTVPIVVSELVPGTLRLGTVQQVLRRLVQERIPLRQLPRILEVLCDLGSRTQDPERLLELLRPRIAGAISQAFQDADHRLRVVRLTSDMEQSLATLFSTLPTSDMDFMDDPQGPLVRSLCLEIERCTRFLTEADLPKVVLVPQGIRGGLARGVRRIAPDLIVLGDAEITADVQLVHIATVGTAALAA